MVKIPDHVIRPPLLADGDDFPVPAGWVAVKHHTVTHPRTGVVRPAVAYLNRSSHGLFVTSSSFLWEDYPTHGRLWTALEWWPSKADAERGLRRRALWQQHWRPERLYVAATRELAKERAREEGS
jgi:hypothetical protein